ncbi:MAG: anaerobic ribonucleoside-triphosphate reductase activating protein [Bacillus sp. (in: firmicutes)]
MEIRLAGPLTRDSIVDGPGLRTVIWTQGCIHQCKGCHNPATHDLNAGTIVQVEDVIEQIRNVKLQRGITLSGGDPMLQAASLVPIAREAKQLGLDVWCYTGFRWEQLMNERAMDHQARLQLLSYIDVLIDGRFVEELKSVDLRFRGSSNQRIIDVSQSLKTGMPVLVEEYMQ